MKRPIALAGTLLLILTACATTGGESTTTATTYSVSGMALAGPTCPVQQYPPDPACADRPVAGATIVVLDASGAQVAETVTASDGTFTVMLASGVYTLVPGAVDGLMGGAPPQVLVVAGEVVGVEVFYDTGIR